MSTPQFYQNQDVHRDFSLIIFLSNQLLNQKFIYWEGTKFSTFLSSHIQQIHNNP